MGVKGLATWLAKTYPSAFVVQADDDRPAPSSRFGAASASRPAWTRPARDAAATAPATFDCVYVDTASVLHTALRKATTPSHFAKLVFLRLDALLAATRPRSLVVLALDGPAPLAKLLTQRRRRRRAGRREARVDDDGASSSSSSDAATSTPRMSSLALTPGTPFMAFVGDAARYYVCARLASRSPLWRGVAVELSGADVPGEGEVKCVARLVAPWSPAAAAAGATHCLVGGDSDLLLMAACADTAGAVFVAVDDPRGRQGVDYAAAASSAAGGRGRGRGGRGRAAAAPRVFSVAALDAALARALGAAAPATPPARAALRRDLAVLAVATCGNDYLPPLRDVTLNAAWRSYVRRAKNAAAASTPPPPIVAVDAATGAVTLNPAALADVLDDAARTGAAAGARAAPPSDDDDDARPPCDPADYAAGLAWVLAMYVSGVCPDHRFAYDARGPAAGELIDALRSAPAPIAPPAPARPPLPPLLCAAALLPPGPVGHDAAPPALRPLWRLDPPSPVADLYTPCAACDELSAAEGAAQRARAAALAELREGADDAATIEAAESARVAVRRAVAARRAHNRAVHPYAPFPLDRLEAAVTDALGGSAGAFGEPALYWRPVGGAPPPSPLAARASPAPLPRAPADKLPELDPVRPPIVRVTLPLAVPPGGATAPPPRVKKRAAERAPRPAVRAPPRKPAAPRAAVRVW